jgi:ABC-type multidrug transport system fused ATPase/permease subunit
MPLYAISQIFGNRLIAALWFQFNDRSTDVSAKAHEILSQFRTVRSFDAEFREYGAYRERLDDMHEVVCRTANVHGLKEAMSTVSLWGMFSVMLLVAGRMAVRREIEPGAIVQLFVMMNNWGFSFAGIFSTINEFRSANVSCAKLGDILDNEVEIPLHEGAKLGHVKGRVECRDVRFRYKSRAENAVDGLSFAIEPGETVALVGESGCGKSTTLALIQRFYDVDEGEILIDGIDIKRLKPLAIRENVAIVPQSPILFSMSVKDNIRFGVPDAGRDEVIAAAKTANADTFIRELPQKYQTLVSQANLSGGQKQRICIARAVMMHAPILLLDEATAALDTENEALVQEALQRYGSGRTTIVVAHRLATVVQASRILVIDHGRVVQAGTHEELLKDEDGVYAHLVTHQLQ